MTYQNIFFIFLLWFIFGFQHSLLAQKSLKDKLSEYMNTKILKIKLVLVSILIVVAIISIPLVTLPGNKFIKHALEWNYFLGVITFYLLTFFMWKKKNN